VSVSSNHFLIKCGPFFEKSTGVLANSKIRTIIASHKIDAARERVSGNYAIHKKAKTAKAFSAAI
jgi:hypothetical protein